MAVTRVHVDHQLLEETKQIFGARTNEDALALALRYAVLRRQQLDTIDAIAALPLDVDPQPITYDRT